MAIKKRLSQKLSLPINQIALRLDAKGKNLNDDLIVQDLNLPSKGAHLYIRVLGPQIRWKTVFLLEYLGPLLIYPIFCLRPIEIYGPGDSHDASRYSMSNGVKFALVCWTFHYAKRLLETQFVHRFSNATMPLRNIFKNCGYYWTFAAFVSYFINHPLYTPPYFGFVQIAIGLIGFVICEFGVFIPCVLLVATSCESNLSTHLLLRNLRPPGTKVRKIPMPNANPMTLMFNFHSFLPLRDFTKWPYGQKTMVAQALQAVVLCGGLGSRMTSLTDHISKCMLPIAGIPMFWYPLNFLQRNSIGEVIMVVAERLLDEIKQLLSSSALPPLTDLQIEFVKLSSAAEHWGTADVLRFINSRIKKDFIVVSGDFVSDMNLAPMLSLHASENAALTCLLCDRVITGPVPGPKMKLSKGTNFQRDFIVLSGNNQLLFNGSEEDYDETVLVNVDVLDKCRIAYFTAKYNDCHLYIMKKCILNIIEKHRELNSLKADLIPYILEKQNAKEDYGIFGTTAIKSLQNPLKCFAYLLSPENGFIVGHVNTIGAYFEINKAIIRFLSRFSEKIPVGHAIIDDNYTATISDCYVGSTTHLLQQSADETYAARSERPIIKRSVIGEKCVLGPRSKIVGSLLMDRCQIGAGAQIINSIICTDAEIGENTYISSSIVVCRQIVSAKAIKNESACCKTGAYFLAARVHNELIEPNDEVELEKWTQEQ
ncbi:unnamed protein product [Acanthocheilonema viteae]|uniref:Translation initiation factor eIF2B subunit gamma n=1 Tax=Acanthocheilonema viteae TaxID=6277 RepID=A0A498SFV1_ACAVI|nr:unnamed protein product [Acanthocheilonema viteae]